MKSFCWFLICVIYLKMKMDIKITHYYRDTMYMTVYAQKCLFHGIKNQITIAYYNYIFFLNFIWFILWEVFMWYMIILIVSTSSPSSSSNLYPHPTSNTFSFFMIRESSQSFPYDHWCSAIHQSMGYAPMEIWHFLNGHQLLTANWYLCY